MVIIKLEQVRFHAFHGLYPGESLVGGEFEINLDVEYDDTGISFESLNNTISYVSLFDIVKLRMKSPAPLLEKIGKDILDEIFSRYPFIKSSRISIYKLQPPVVQFQGRLGVSLNRKY